MEIKDLIGKKVSSKKFGEGTVEEICSKNMLTIRYSKEVRKQAFPGMYPNIFEFTDPNANMYAERLKKASEDSVQQMMKKEADIARRNRLVKESESHNDSGSSLVMPVYSDKAFIKFEGTTLTPDNIWMVNSVIDDDGERKYLLNFSNVGERIEEDSEFYITKGDGKNVFLYGRGFVSGFKQGNTAKKSWVDQHPWMRDPKTIKEGRLTRDKYVFVKECEVLNTELQNCPTLMSIYKEYGGDVLDSKKGKQATMDELAKSHFQKSHVFLSEDGYKAFNEIFEEAAGKFGTYRFITKNYR